MANRPPPVSPTFTQASKGRPAPDTPKQMALPKTRGAPTFEYHPPGMSKKTLPPPELQLRAEENLQKKAKTGNNTVKDIFNQKAR